MNEPANVAVAYIAEARKRLTACQEKIHHCVSQLNDEQLWWRPKPEMNSIANLLLHLCGNITQHIIAPITKAPDRRDRPKEFSERGPMPKAEVMRRFDSVIAETDAALARMKESQLLESRRIQASDTTILAAMFGSLVHLGGHTQEIIGMTRQQLGERYKFAWMPKTPEQGAPKP
ncbi:MAG: DUF1572 family protein [Planctomycetes bacterium]|nr:DUF1572 family protein [Planctomycetota bacterium]